MPLTQTDKIAAITTPLGEDVLLLVDMETEERLGAPFTYHVSMLSTDGNIGFQDLVGERVSIRLTGAGPVRHFNGFVSRFELAGAVIVRDGDASRTLTRYRATIVPWLWFLTRTADCRVFQDMTVPEIVMQVFRDHGFSDFDDALTGTYRKRTYCVQYRETDFDFVSRLLEQEGIYYFFEHESSKHTLVLADGVASHAPMPGYDAIAYYPPDAAVVREEEYISAWSVGQQVQPGSFALNEFNFRSPQKNLRFNSVISRTHAMADYAMYDYPGDYVNDGGDDAADEGENDAGHARARTRIEELQAQHEIACGAANVSGMLVGGLFTLEGFPRMDQNREYLVTSTTCHISNNAYGTSAGGGADIAVSFAAIDAQTPFRPARVTPRPLMHGPQTAVVVGPTSEEIWTDQHGRVKVQFHWDRYGAKDENSSCWVRVAHPWAGRGWGAVHIPRIGHEVLVDFLEGDIDRPIIVGSVYNGENKPPYLLPDHRSQSGLRTRSTQEGNEETFNELRFEDKKDEEEVYFHAERDFNRVVENNDTLKVGFEKTEPGDQTIEIYNNQTIAVGADGCGDGSQTLTVQGNRTKTIKTGNETITLEQGNRETTLSQGNDKLTITQGDHEIKVSAGSSTIEAGQKITLKVGSCSIELSTTGITIKAPQIAITGDAKVDVGSPSTTVKGDGMLTLQGGLVKIN